MANPEIHFKFNVGDKVVCVEGGGGYGEPIALDTVTISVRAQKENGKVGARDAVTHFAHRAELAAIGMSFLDLARRMAPETMWARGETIAGQGKERHIFPLSATERRETEKYLNEVGPTIIRDVAATFNKLRKRMPILQRMQFLLERVDDQTAAQLDVLLAMVEHTGTLPFKLVCTPMVPEGQEGDEVPQGAKAH